MLHCSLWTNLKIEKPKERWNTRPFWKRQLSVSQSVCVCEIVKLSGFERPQKFEKLWWSKPRTKKLKKSKKPAGQKSPGRLGLITLGPRLARPETETWYLNPQMGTPTFCPMLNISQNKERNHSFTDLSSIYLSCYTNQQFSFSAASVLIEEVNIFVSLSRQGPRVPPFSTSKVFSSREYCSTVRPRLLLDLRSGNIWWVHHFEILADLNSFPKIWLHKCPASLNEFLL